MENFNRHVILHDSNGNKFDIKCEIEYRNNRDTFSVSGDGGGSSGQNEDNIKPRTDNQRKLLELWDNYHLNGMSVGTEKQMKLLRDYKIIINASDYNSTVDYLQKHKFDGNELTVGEYDRNQKAIKDYQERLASLKELYKNIIGQAGNRILYFEGSYSAVVEGKEKFVGFNYTNKNISIEYFKEFKEIIGSRNTFDHDKLNSIQSDYGVTFRKEKLKEIFGKITVQYSDDLLISAYVDIYKFNPYLYGHGWIYKTLSNDFKDNLVKLLDDLDSEEEEYNSNPIRIDMLKLELIVNKASDLDITPEKLMAMCLCLDVSIEGLDNISKGYGDNNFEIEGTDYLVCTDDEANEETKKDIEQSCSYFRKKFLANQTDMPVEVFEGLSDKNESVWKLIQKTCGEDEFVEASIQADGRGHFLNHYDGKEYEQKVGDETFYLYKG